jgi:flotillin
LAQSAEERALAEIEKNKELARREAEEARAKRTQAALNAEQIVPAEITKQQKLINAQGYQLQVEKEAEANANQKRIEAQGHADAITAEGLAHAKVIEQQGLAKAAAEKASLMAQAEGFEAMVKVAENNPQVAIQWKMVEQWKEIAAEQVKAFENIKLGNVNVMDTSQGGTLTNLLTSLVSSVAPVTDIMKTIPGIPSSLRIKDSNSSNENETK